MWRIHNADFREVLPEIIDEADDPAIITDPPFNIGYGYDRYADRMDESDYYSMLAELREFCPLVVIHYPEQLHRLSITIGECPRKVCSWVYNANTEKQHRDIAFYGIKPDFDLVKRPYYSLKDKRCRERMERTGGARSYDWGYCDLVKNKSAEKTGHPCQMPLDIMRYVVGITPAKTIIDPFMGSGTTGVAAVMGGKDFSGCELSDEYFGIARERLSEAERADKTAYMQMKLF